jgi:hypothetical protein
MARRTKEDWRKLIEEQSNGDLSVAEFCKQHQLGQTYFYKRKSDLKKLPVKAQPSNFIKVRQPKTAPVDSVSIKLQCQSLELSLPLSLSPSWLAELIKALA